MTPGATTWAQVVPTVLVVAALLFVPGAVMARILGASLLTSISLAPVISTTVLAGAGMAVAGLGISWGLAPLAGSVLAAWICAATVAHLTGRRLSSHRRRREGEKSAQEACDRRHVAYATAGGVVFAVVVVAAVLVPLSVTPDHFPQHPDTIFHLGTARWMVEQRDASVLDANGFLSGTGTSGYPAAFHVVSSSTALIGGTNVVVATSACVLVLAGVVWPLGMMLLGRALFGSRADVTAATAVTSVLFTAFPFAMMGYGVLWPNLFGQSLLPAAVALAMAVVVRIAPHRHAVLPPAPAAVLLLTSLPGLTLAHPNATVSLLVLVYLILLVGVLRRVWEARRTPGPLRTRLLGIALAMSAPAIAFTALRRESMVRSRPLGPEEGLRAALVDTLFFAPRQGAPLVLLSVVVGLGAVSLMRRNRGAGWVVAALILCLSLFFLNVAVDSPEVRYLTWPWYNDPIRLAAISVLPAALCASAGVLAVGAIAAPHLRRLPSARMATTGAVLTALVLGTGAYIGPHRDFLQGYFTPSPARSWASDDELRALNHLARYIPPGAVTAANPWNGATYLYVTSGRRLLIPTEKALTRGDRTLLAAQLDRVGTSVEVCEAARRQGVEYAITGGQPFATVGARRLAQYRGIDKVGDSSAFVPIAKEGPYRLYALADCAGDRRRPTQG